MPVANSICRACGGALTGGSASGTQLCYPCLLEAALEPEDEEEPGSSSAGGAALLPAGVAGAAGRSFAHYEIALDAAGFPSELGRGAMAVTYRAIDTILCCPVALKVISVDLARQPRIRTRFLREAQAAAGLRHPHIASVFFFGERLEDGHPFYAMELVEGETLQARVQRAGGLPSESALQMAEQVAEALAAAEARGVTHRDLKPANLMLVHGKEMNVKVIDFGLAKAALAAGQPDPGMTQAQEFIGTPAFASPEQFKNGTGIDGRSDFYALGATLWYALTGHAPFAGGTLAEIHERQMRQPLPLAQLRSARVPRPVEELLRRLLAPAAAGRPQTAQELAQALACCREQLARRSPRARWTAAGLVGGAVALLLAAAIISWEMYRHVRSPAALPKPAPGAARSLAVLPFDNLSADKSNAFFADGVQDEILTDLAHVASLKVISRTSVLGYSDPNKRPPAREIARALDVSYLLEGSLQREADRVRLNVQLIDAAHDRQVWAETFDRDLSNIFSIESEVAATITEKLRTQLSGAEKVALDEAPTHDFAAYELFLRAKELAYNFDPNTSKWDPLFECARLLEEATSRDPAFFEAWCSLTNIYANLLFFNADPTPVARQAQAEHALATVRRLRPDAGETHLAAANYYYNIRDSARGRPELARARQELPNNFKVQFLSGTTGMIEGHWAEGLSAMERARALNPLAPTPLSTLSKMDQCLRRFDDAKKVAEEAMAAGINPDYFALDHARSVQRQTGDAAEYQTVFRRLAGQGPPSERTFVIRWSIALWSRDFDEAARIVAADPRQDFTGGNSPTIYPRAFFTGSIAYARGDIAAARKDYETVRPFIEEAIRKRPDNATYWLALGDLDARLGRKEEAVREGEHALRLRPISLDGQEGPDVAVNLASIYAMVGQKDRAIGYLKALENVPGAYNYGILKTDPDWDILRGQPGFADVIEASRAPVDLAKFNPADFGPNPPPPVP